MLRRSCTPSLLLLALVLPGCQKGEDRKNRPPTAGPDPTLTLPKPVKPVGDDIESQDILKRTQTEASVEVKHVLIGWKDLADAYQGQMDPRAAERTEAEARTLAADIAGRMTRETVNALMKEYSEDP